MFEPLLSTLARRRAPAAAGGEGGIAYYTLILVIFINVLGFGIVVPLLPFYGESFKAAPWQISLVFSAFSAGSFFGEPIWGRMSDRIGRKPLLISTTCGTCLCYLALSFAPNVWVAILVRFLGGLASGNGSVVQGYIADVTPASRRSGRIARMGAAFNVGFIVGPALGGLLAHPELGPIGFQIPLLTAAALSAMSATGVLLFVRESRARQINAEPPPSRYAMAARAFSHPVVGRLLLLTFVAGFAFTGVESTFGLWAQHRFGWGPHQTGWCFMAVGVSAALTNSLLTGRLAREFGEAAPLAFGMCLAALSALTLTVSTGMAMTIAIMALMAMGQSAAFPNVSALISRVTNADHQGQVLGLNNAAGASARVSGPFCAGIVFSAVSTAAPFMLAAVVVAPAVYLALAAGKRAQTAPTL